MVELADFESIDYEETDAIAVIGMACRFPKSNNVDVFWQNIAAAKELITYFSEEQLAAAGVSSQFLTNPSYVKAKGIVEGVADFDASFFKISPQEAAMLDPQVRLFIETTWQALEHAGYATEKYDGTVGVFAGMADSTYLRANLLRNQKIRAAYDYMQLHIATGGNFMATRTSYLLGLTGPSLNINTACSTSLVVIHEACRHLQSFECDLAVAGGVSVYLPQERGYLYQAEGILSPDGHCRVFDSNAAGTVPSGGVGVVVLKRLAEAVADGDHIEGIILGTAINNDGSTKVGFSAPSVQGQALCIKEALEMSNVQPEQVSYIETHGTGTLLGDPIEIAALAKVFPKRGDKAYCALGSVKTNIGHTDCAAGVAGFIKTISALKHKLIPASLHFQEANPRLNLANTPFYINQQLQAWQPSSGGRIAGVSAFGIGGTNAHAILREPPVLTNGTQPTRSHQLLLLSAKTATALEKQWFNLQTYLAAKPLDAIEFANVAYTLQIGRNDFNYRAAVVADSATTAIQIIRQQSAELYQNAGLAKSNNKIVFMYPGQGMQYSGMAQSLYKTETVYQQAVDECCAILQTQLAFDLKPILFPDLYTTDELAKELINQTQYAQPALFITGYALTKLLNAWGIYADALIGHSLGEYVAAYFAGLFRLEDVLKIVVLRGRLMAQAQPGVMLAVMLPKSELLALLDSTELELAAENSPSLCVLTAKPAAIENLENKLAALFPDKPICKRLHTSHAFHSYLMEPILAEFATILQTVNFQRPHTKFMSNLTGDWVQEEAMSPNYWLKQLRHTVQFNTGVQNLLAHNFNLFVEVGPGNGLSRLLKQQAVDKLIAVHTLAHAQELAAVADIQTILQALAKLWLQGVNINWQNFYKDEKRKRIALPTYPFESKRHWIEPDVQQTVDRITAIKPGTLEDYLYQTVWFRTQPIQQAILPDLPVDTDLAWLILSDNSGLAELITEHLAAQKQKVVQLKPSHSFSRTEHCLYIDPLNKQHYLELAAELKLKKLKIIHLWCLEQDASWLEQWDKYLALAFYSLTYLAQMCIEHTPATEIELLVACSELYKVLGDESINPMKGLLLGPSIVLPQEDSRFKTKLIDIGKQNWELSKLANNILLELAHFPEVFQPLAYRNNYCWRQTYTKAIATQQDNFNFVKQGVYLITGGLGGIGLTFAKFLAEHYQANLILLSRSGVPPEQEWQAYLQHQAAEPAIQARITALQAIKQQAKNVVIYQADVADEQAMLKLIQDLSHDFGTIHGVIHTAGVAGGEVLLRASQTSSDQVFKPKIQGTLALVKALAGRSLDCLVLCSSLTAHIGRAGQLSYCAANNFLNSFAEAGAAHIKQVVAVNWNRWLEVGMAVHDLGPITHPIHELLANDAISPKQAQQLLLSALSCNMANLLVSTYDLPRYLPEVANALLAKPLTTETVALATQSADSLNTSIEQQLTNIFQQILGVTTLGVNDDFFELGGHSLLALQLIAAIHKMFGIKLLLDRVYRLRTINSLAKFIAAPDISHSAISSIVTLKAEGSKLPVFFIHPIGGTAFCYIPLVKFMAAERPYYALQDPGINQDLDFSQFAEVVDFYLTQIKKIQPTGPYALVGASYGGTVAYELAEKLLQQGEQVQLICMLDSWADFSSHFHDQDFFNNIMSLKQQKLLKQSACNQLPDEFWRDLQWKRMQLLLRFKPSKLKTQVVLIKAAELLEEYRAIDEPANHWRNYAETIVVEKVPGDHETMLNEQNAVHLSKIINRYLQNCP